MDVNILHISDTHGKHKNIKLRDQPVDIVIFSGDCSNYKDPYFNEKEVFKFIDWFGALPYKEKIFVAGNHDTSIEHGLVPLEAFKNAGITYLHNESYSTHGLNIWGSPYTPAFGTGWAFNLIDEHLKKCWDEIPENTDILISHGPCLAIQDRTIVNNEIVTCGDKYIKEKIFTLPQIKLHCFGHIHSYYKRVQNHGVMTFPSLSRDRTIHFSNGSCVMDGKDKYKIDYHGNYLTLKV